MHLHGTLYVSLPVYIELRKVFIFLFKRVKRTLTRDYGKEGIADIMYT